MELFSAFDDTVRYDEYEALQRKVRKITEVLLELENRQNGMTTRMHDISYRVWNLYRNEPTELDKVATEVKKEYVSTEQQTDHQYDSSNKYDSNTSQSECIDSYHG